jgi:hypothetical protein
LRLAAIWRVPPISDSSPVTGTKDPDPKFTSHSAKRVKTAKRWFEAGPCEGPGCTNIVPAGFYAPQRKRYFCSMTCSSRADSKHVIGTSIHCDGPILEPKVKAGVKKYCTQACRWLHKTEEMLEPTGSFRPIIEEYMATACQ